MNKRIFKSVFLIAAMISGVAAADIAQVEYHGLQKGTGNIVLPGFHNNAYGGLIIMEKLNGDLPMADNSNFISFCIELNEDLRTGDNPMTYNVMDPQYASNTTPMGPARAGLLSAWFGQYWQGTSVDAWTRPQAVAFQLGIWEIIYEDYNSIGSVNNGTLYVADNSGSAALTARTQADNWFSAFNPNGPKRELLALSSPSGQATQRVQDQITITPEPLTVGLLAMGGALMLKRRKKTVY